MSKFRPFEVTPGVSGFKVRVGCSELYFSTPHELKKAISLYLTNPVAVEEAYLKKDIRYSGPTVQMEPAGLAEITRIEPPQEASRSLAGQPANVYVGSARLRGGIVDENPRE
jgi:hypothetical protein